MVSRQRRGNPQAAKKAWKERRAAHRREEARETAAVPWTSRIQEDSEDSSIHVLCSKAAPSRRPAALEGPQEKLARLEEAEERRAKRPPHTPLEGPQEKLARLERDEERERSPHTYEALSEPLKAWCQQTTGLVQREGARASAEEFQPATTSKGKEMRKELRSRIRDSKDLERKEKELRQQLLGSQRQQEPQEPQELRQSAAASSSRKERKRQDTRTARIEKAVSASPTPEVFRCTWRCGMVDTYDLIFKHESSCARNPIGPMLLTKTRHVEMAKHR